MSKGLRANGAKTSNKVVRNHFRMKRLVPPLNSRILCLPIEAPGTVLVDNRGRHYCAVANREGRFGGIRRMTDKDIELSRKLGIPARPSMTIKELMEVAFGEGNEKAPG